MRNVGQCPLVVGLLSVTLSVIPASALADHHESDQDSNSAMTEAPARMSTDADGTLSVEGTGIQEVEAAARSDVAAGTESVEGTGLNHAGSLQQEADGTQSVEGTGLVREAPAVATPGDSTESVEGTGLMDASSVEATPVAIPDVAEPVTESEGGDGN